MKSMLLISLLATCAHADFNGEIETPTLVWHLGLPTLASPASAADIGTGHISHDTYIAPFYYHFPPNGPVTCPGCSASPRVRAFINQSVFFGDSITAGWDLKGFFGVSGVVNKGIHGETTAQIASRFLSGGDNASYKGVFILGGINDIISGKVPINQAENNILQMVNYADRLGQKVFVGTLVPSVNANSSGAPTGVLVDQVDSFIKSFCNGKNCTTIDYNTVLGGPKFNVNYHIDTTHPNNQGYTLMTDAVLRAVVASINTPSNRTAPALIGTSRGWAPKHQSIVHHNVWFSGKKLHGVKHH